MDVYGFGVFGVSQLQGVLLVHATSSKLTPAPYEKAQTSEEKIYVQAVVHYIHSARTDSKRTCTTSDRKKGTLLRRM